MDELQNNEALLSFQIPTQQGVAELRASLRQIPKSIKVRAASSVYKRYHNTRFEDLNSHLICVLHVATDLDAWALNDELIILPGIWSLLSFGKLVSIAPDLPLPNPILFEDSALLRCASEAWGSYEHPVLGQSLNELVRSVHSFGNVEFFAQGRSIL